MRLPCTRTNGFGVLSVTGARRALNPAAMITARFTRYGSRALYPALVMVYVSGERNPFAHKSENILFTVPSDLLSEVAIFLCVTLSPEDSRNERTVNSFCVSIT